MLVEHGYFHGPQLEVVGQEDQCPVRFAVMVFYAPELFGIVLGGIEPGKPDGLVASQPFGLVDLFGIYPLELEVLLRPSQKICARQVNPVKPCEVEVAPVHHVKGAGQKDQHVEHLDMVHLAVRYMDEVGYGGLRVHFRMHLYRRLGLAELGPRI